MSGKSGGNMRFKSFISTFLILSFIILQFGCANAKNPQKPDESAVPDGSAPGNSFDPQTDFDNRFATQYLFLAENDGVFVWKPVVQSELLRYYVKETGESGVLCSKPECMHRDHIYNDECNGCVFSAVRALSYYNGQLYWVGYYSGSDAANALYRMDPDSTGRELVWKVDPPSDFAVKEYEVHRGKLYGLCVNQTVSAGEPQYSMAVICADLNDAHFETVLYDEFVCQIFYADSAMIRFVGNRVYMAYSYQDQDGKDLFKVMRWDSKTEAAAELFSTYEIPSAVQSMWINENEDMVLVPLLTDDQEQKLYRVRGGALEAYLNRLDENGEFNGCHISDGIICNYESVRGEWFDSKVWIRDFEGNTLFKGQLPTDFLAETPGEIKACSIMTTIRDGNAIIVPFSIPYLSSAEGGGIETAYYLARYEITEGGLRPTLMLSCTSEF